MQRRAAAIYVVFFVVVAIVAFSVTTVAEPPEISIEDGRRFTQGENLTIGGETFTVNVSGGSGQVSTVNRSARFTAALSDNTTLRFVNGTYQPVPNGSIGGGGTVTGATQTGGTTTTPGAVGTSVPTGDSDSNLTSRLVRVVIPNATSGNASAGNATGGNATGGNASVNITTFTLREVLDVQGLLVADPTVADTTLTTENGTEFVRFQNGTTQPLREYLPPINTRNVSVGEQFPYQGNLTTVARINSSAATLAWEGTVVETMELEEGTNVTIENTTFVPHFPTNDTVILTQDIAAYQAEQQQIAHFHDRILGLWGVVIISLFAAILIAALAYLPVRG